MSVFNHVRLRNGLGWVCPVRGVVTPPLDREAFSVAPGGDERALPFYLVDTPRWIAVIPEAERNDRAGELEQRATELLLGAGCFAVVCLGLEGPGAAIARAWSCEQEVLSDVGAALWAVRALAGLDEASPMTFAVTCWPSPAAAKDDPIGRTTTLVARGSVGKTGGRVDVRLPRPGAARGFWALVVERGGPSACGVAVGDVDQMMAFNDAYGHQVGDLVIARIGAALEGLADDLGAVYMRIAGDEVALLVDEHGQAGEAARAMERAVAELRIPFRHETIRSGEHVSLTAVAIDTPEDLASPDPLSAAGRRIDVRKGAKRAAWNRR